jgi:hypothetical protein
MERYLKMKRQARHLMMKGDVVRYMRLLREMYALRTAGPAVG